MKVTTSSQHTKISSKLEKYIQKKVGGLNKYIPLRERRSANCTVRIKDATVKQKSQFECEVTLILPKKTLVIKEIDSNAFAAIDSIVTKLKLSLKEYKDKYTNPKVRQRLAVRQSKKLK